MKQLRMTLPEIERIILNHQKWLKGDYFESASFIGKGLWRMNFSGKDLRYACFQRANLKRADFSGADLFFANFEGADLKAVNFEGANLEGANFKKANLERAKLSNAKMGKTDFSGANLTGAHLKKDSVKECDFTGADLTGTELKIKEEGLTFFLKEMDGEVHLMVKQGNEPFLLLTITRKGTLRRAKNVPKSLGFDLDTEGRIVLLN